MDSLRAPLSPRIQVQTSSEIVVKATSSQTQRHFVVDPLTPTYTGATPNPPTPPGSNSAAKRSTRSSTPGRTARSAEATTRSSRRYRWGASMSWSPERGGGGISGECGVACGVACGVGRGWNFTCPSRLQRLYRCLLLLRERIRVGSRARTRFSSYSDSLDPLLLLPFPLPFSSANT